MKDTAILFPVIVQVWLTLFLLLKLGISRYSLAKSGAVRMKDIAIDSDAWPDDIRKVSNCVLNQFQVPVLFYLICVLLLVTHLVDSVHIILAWIFVISRLVHAYIHTGSNLVRQRFSVFVIGITAVVIMWGYFTLSFLLKSL